MPFRHSKAACPRVSSRADNLSTAKGATLNDDDVEQVEKVEGRKATIHLKGGQTFTIQADIIVVVRGPGGVSIGYKSERPRVGLLRPEEVAAVLFDD